MILTEEQKDSLVEVINIAFGRAAGSLSTITGQRVLLSVPNVSVCPIGELHSNLEAFIQGDVATVHQIFSGPIAGSALLVLDYKGAVLLSGLLTEGRVPIERLDASDREVLTEVGNILLNACLGTFGNLLKVHISFSVPRLHVEALGGLLNSLTIDSKELQIALMVLTNFQLRDSAVGGYLVIVLGVSSLDQLVESIGKME
ncbi:MAG TPA: hypothetical protein PLM79_16235 [Syntrophobacteraceae bacterium]|nr:hypothetical protein [Syntrophobacteraceae bacterium]